MKKSKIDKLSKNISDAVIGKYNREFQKNYEIRSKEYTPDIAISKAINDSLPVLVKEITERLIDELS